MRRISKYSRDHQGDSKLERIKAYQVQAESILENSNKYSLRSRSISPLAAIVPLVAVAMTPVGLTAQCGASILAPASAVQNGTDMTIDVDGDGAVDFILEPRPDHLLIQPQGSAEVIAGSSFAGYFYVSRLEMGDAISSRNENWKSGKELIDGAATMAYADGGWDGPGIMKGYVGIRIDGDRLGFIEVSWDDESLIDIAAVTTESTGVQDDANRTIMTVGTELCSAIVPVELIDFEVKNEGDEVGLNWSTVSETNNAGFEIQRSTDGIDFRKVAWVQGEGNSSVQLSYSFNDKSALKNVQYYYRLKQVDFDGRFAFSDILSIVNRDLAKHMLDDIAPNPVTSNQVQLSISAGSNARLHLDVFDSVGKRYINKTIEVGQGNNSIELDLAGLPNAAYFVKLSSKDYSTYKKMILAK